MIKNIKKLLCVFLSVFVYCSFMPFSSQTADAVVEKSNDLCETEGKGECNVTYNNDRVIVSLGDSYSSGEGLGDFYGAEYPITKRMLYNKDWLCHRSKNAWSGMLELKSPSGNKIIMNEHRATDNTDGNWYFAAMSGAVTDNVLDANSALSFLDLFKKTKTFDKRISLFDLDSSGFDADDLIPYYINGGIAYYEANDGVVIESQLNTFKKLGDKKAEYVTITMGGNDIGFSSIVTTAVMGCSYLENSLSKKLQEAENTFPKTMSKLHETYSMISEAAGPQAHIIVADYPRLIALLEKSLTKSLVFYPEKTLMLDNTVVRFDNQIKKLVHQCELEGMNISFVDVYNAFGNEVAYYSNEDDELINRIMLTQWDDLDDFELISAYSIHPNINGAKKYANCVQQEINKIETSVTLTGNVTDSETKPNPLEGTTVTIETLDGEQVAKTVTSEVGNYLLMTTDTWLPANGQKYKITFEKEGYLPFTVYETADKNNGNNITIDVKLVKGFLISGEITDTDGKHLNGVNVTISDSNNNIYKSEIVNGEYSFTLESVLGRTYKVEFEKKWYNGFTKYVTIKDSNTDKATVNAVLTQKQIKISGTVTDNYNQPFDGVEVTLYDDYNNFYGNKFTKNGKYSFKYLLTDDFKTGRTFKLVFEKDGCDTVTKYVALNENDIEKTATVNAKLEYKWKKAYIDYVNALAKYRGNSYVYWIMFDLVNIDDDDVPELAINFGDEASGAVVCTYYDGKVVEKKVSNYGFTYLEKKNLFANNFMKQGYYSHGIYTIKNGEFVMLHSGGYGEVGGTKYPYVWDDVTLPSLSAYNSKLNAAFDFDSAIYPFRDYKPINSWNDIINGIKKF